MSGKFAKDLKLIADNSKRSLNQIARAVVIELFTGIISDTPVDTGELRGNWQTSIGGPKTATITRSQKAKKGSATEEVKNVIPKEIIGTVAYLTNNLPYAEVAEYGGWSGPTDKVTDQGYSRKAPEGMVRRNMARVKRNVAEKAKEYRT